MAKRRKTRRRRTTKRRTTKRHKKTKTTKRKLAGFTKTKGKFALVFKRGRKLSVGKGRFKSKKTLIKAAKRFV